MNNHLFYYPRIELQHPDFHTEKDLFLKELSEIDVELEPTSKLFEHLKNPNPEVVQHALATLLFRLQQFIRGPLKDASSDLQRKVKSLAKEVLHLGRLACDDTAKKTKADQLFSAKLIESRIKSTIDDDWGFDLLARQVNLEQHAIEELGELAEQPYALELHQVGKFILDEKVRQGWVEFIKDLFRMDDKNLIKALVTLVHSLAKRDFLAIVMNSRFPELLQYNFPPAQLLRAMQIKGFTVRLEKLQKLRETIELTDKAIDAFLKSEEFKKMYAEKRRDKFVELSTPIFQLQYRLAKKLNENSVASLAKADNTSIGKFLGTLKKYWIQQMKKDQYSYELNSFDSIDDSKLSIPVEHLSQSMTLFTLAKLSQENCKTQITVLESRICALLSQILNSKIGPLVHSFLKLRDAKFVYAKLNYPWLQLQINFPFSARYTYKTGASIDLRYHMQKGKVELQFTAIGTHEIWRRNLVILAYVATHALKGVRFEEGKIPVSKGNYTLLFTWCFDLPKEEGPFEENLSHMISSLLESHSSDQTVFARALKCCRLTGKKKTLVDLLKILPDSVINQFFENDYYWIKFCSIDAAFELLQPACIEYLKNERTIISDKILFEILIKLLKRDGVDDDQERIRESIQKQFTFETICALVESATKEFSHLDQIEFLQSNLALLSLIYPALYSRYKTQVIQFFSKVENLGFKESEDFPLMGFHLSFWTTQECFQFLDLLTRVGGAKDTLPIGTIIFYLRSPGIVAEFKKCVIRNRAWVTYLKGIKNAPYIRKNTFSSFFPDSKEELEECSKRELSNFHELAATCDAKTLLTCILIAPSELAQSLERFLTKEAVDATIIREKYHEETFYSETLLNLCNAHPRWLNLYQRELLNLVPTSGVFEYGISSNVAGMIADILEQEDLSTRIHYYKLLLQDVRKYDYKDIPMAFLYVLLSCKDKKMQKEMVAYLVHENRWDLIMRGSWSHQENTQRVTERMAGLQLLREQFTPERLQQLWEKNPGSNPCIIMGDSRLKGVAYQYVFSDSKKFKSFLLHYENCTELKSEVLVDFLSHFGALQDDVIKNYIEILDHYKVDTILKILGFEECPDTIWRRFLPFLRDLPERLPELPTYFHNLHRYDKKYQTMMTDLGWQLPIEDK